MSSTGDSSDVLRLRRKLMESEEFLQTAAQHGLELLASQLDLQNKLEEQRVEMTNAMEALEQEKYSLQREVELKARMLESLRSECEAIKGQQKLQWEQQEAQLERRHTVELNDLKNKMERMTAVMEEVLLSDKQLRHKLDVQAESLREKAEELRALTERDNVTTSTEMLELQAERLELESAKDALQQALQEEHYKVQQLELSNTTLLRQQEHLRDEKQEREKEAVSYFNALEKSREEVQLLQIQLDQAARQAQDPNSTGNSLFSELEDKRAAMERQLIGIKVQHQSLQKRHAFSQQQLHRMKVQIATLMQLQGSRADPAQLERLQSILSEKNSEIEALMMKLRRLEKMEMMMVKAQPSSAPPVEEDSNDETYYTDLLKMQLSNSVKGAEQLGDELNLQRIKALSESQRVLEMERKLFGAERTLKHCQSDNIRLQVKLDELRLKYEPNDMNKARNQKRRREKLPVDILPVGSEQKEEKTQNVETNLSDWLKQEADAEPRPQPAEQPSAAPPLPFPTPERPAQLPRDSKCVRICDDPPVAIPSRPRSPSGDCKIETEVTAALAGDESRQHERKKQVKSVGGIHAASELTMEDKCAQQ